MIKAGEIWLESDVPFLSLPVVKQAEEEIINFLSDSLFDQIVIFVDISAIKLVNSAHQSAFDKASVNLKIIAHDKGIDSKEFQEARDAAKIALSKFTQFGSH